MKARVKATGNIVDVKWYGHNSMGTIYADVTHTAKYYEYELDFDTVYDYWTRLKHQYAGQFMQAMISSSNYIDVSEEAMADASLRIAHALVEKLKEKEERK